MQYIAVWFATNGITITYIRQCKKKSDNVREMHMVRKRRTMRERQIEREAERDRERDRETETKKWEI